MKVMVIAVGLSCAWGIWLFWASTSRNIHRHLWLLLICGVDVQYNNHTAGQTQGSTIPAQLSWHSSAALVAGKLHTWGWMYVPSEVRNRKHNTNCFLDNTDYITLRMTHRWNGVQNTEQIKRKYIKYKYAWNQGQSGKLGLLNKTGNSKNRKIALSKYKQWKQWSYPK